MAGAIKNKQRVIPTREGFEQVPTRIRTLGHGFNDLWTTTWVVNTGVRFLLFTVGCTRKTHLELAPSDHRILRYHHVGLIQGAGNRFTVCLSHNRGQHATGRGEK